MNEPNYRVEGNQIFSIKSGNLVAILTADGEVVMQNGYNGQGRKIREFLDSNPAPAAAPAGVETETGTDECPATSSLETVPPGCGGVYIGDAPAAPASGILPAPDLPEGDCNSRFLVDSIPDAELPRLDPVLGIATPEVAAFIKKHRMTGDQITALFRKLELKLKAE